MSQEPLVRPSRREHAEALLLALLCALLFLRGSLLPGRALVPHPPELFDVPLAEALAAGRFDADEMLRGNAGMADKYLQSLCWDRVMRDRFRSGELPLWTNDIGGGAPFVPQMAQPWQPINLLLLALPAEQWYGWWYLIHQVLFGWFTYQFLRRLGCQHLAALLGLVAAVLGLWTQCKVHHNVILTAALSLWPMLSMAHELVARGAAGGARRRAVAWLGLWTGLSWSTGFVVVALQTTYLTALAAGLWALAAPSGERLRRLAPVGLGFALGALLAAGNMLPILAAAADSARPAFDAARQAALGLEWDHALALLWPDLLSWPADRFYLPADGDPRGWFTRLPWSQLVLLSQPLRPGDHSGFQHWVETSWSIGLMPVALAAVAPFAAGRRALALAVAAIGFLAFGLATADQPFLGVAQWLPGLSAGDLRRQLFAAAMALVVLGALGADTQLRTGRRRPVLAVTAVAVVGSLVGLIWLARHADAAAFVRGFAELFVADRNHPDVRQIGGSAAAAAEWTMARMAPGEALHNRAMLMQTAWRALLVAGSGAAALWLGARARAVVWIALSIAELLHAGQGPVVAVPAEHVARLPLLLEPVVAAASSNGERPRLCRLVAPGPRQDEALPPNLPGFLGCEDGAAYNPLPPARYAEFFAAIDPAAVQGGSGVGAFRDPAALAHPLADLYGLRFVLTRADLPAAPGLVDRTPPGAGGYRLLERVTAMPRATFVHEVDMVPDPAARLAMLADPGRDVRARIVLEDATAPAVDSAPAVAATVSIATRTDELVVVEVATQRAGYLRLADPFAPGWRALLDGRPARLFAADHYLRAVYVPAGEHQVVFRYDGPQVLWPLRLSGAGVLLLLWLWWSARRRP